ncbi:MAG: hypothetical protein AB8G23_08195 [Myxococcota bacterium]
MSGARRFFGFLLLSFLLGCSPSDVGNQSGSGPTAIAAAVGVGAETGGAYQVRAGSEVVVSGKDSEGGGAPILEYEWSQVSGTSVDLFERTNISRSFTAPSVEDTLVFELTVTDSKGKTFVDTVEVDVVPVLDDGKFLRDPSVEEEIFFFISPNSPPATVAATIPYSLTVQPIVYWTDRSGGARSQVLASVLEVSDQIEAGFTVPGDPVDSTQDRFVLALPLLDADEVNVFFQDALRAGRLELEEVPNARVELEVALVGSGDFEVYVGRSDSGSYALIEGADIVASGETPTAAGGILEGSDGEVRLELEALRQELGVESRRSASNYYDCIDPAAEAATLSGWLTATGFDGATDVTNAKYVNNYDLGFGRDMYMRDDGAGNVYSYVVNYPSLEQLLKGQGEFATVAMEFSPKPEGSCDAPTFSATEKIVKFYAFVPDTTTGEMVRAESMNFDGRGERFMPGVCTACHDGSITNIAALGQSDLSLISAENADLAATFMPWDLDSLLFAEAEDEALVDPDLNPDEFTTAELAAVSYESQQAALRSLNEASLLTYQGDLRRYEEPLRMIHGWYGNEAALPAPIVDDPMTAEDETDDLLVPSPLESASEATLTTLPAVAFDGSYVQPGWAGEEALYEEVYSRYCRMCHTQQDNLDKNFESYDEFVEAAALSDFVFVRGVMPAARLTLDRFWVDFAGSDPSAAEMLRDHLIGEGVDLAADAVPGQPVAQATVTPTSVDAVDGAGDLVSTTINLDGSGSLFAESYAWSVTDDSGCGGSPLIAGSSSAQASFAVDTSPCEYTVTLEVDSGIATSESETLVTTNRTPVTNNFTASLSGYTPGDATVDVDVFAQLPSNALGDGDLVLGLNDPDPPFNLVVNANASEVSDGVIRLVLDSRLGGTMDSVQYQLVDANGTLAESIGVVSVDVDAIAPVLSTTGGSLTESSVTIEWSVPSGFVADDYSVLRDGPSPDGNFGVIATTASLNYADSSLSSGESYEYRVAANLDGESANSNDLAVSTAVGVPSGLMGGVTTSSVSLSWTAGPGSAPDGYTVYRDNAFLGTTTGSGMTAYVDSSVSQNTSYSYEVSQTRNGVESGRSTAAAMTTNTAPATGFSASPDFGTSDAIDLAWSAPAGGTAPSNYRIYRGGALIRTQSGLTYTDTGLDSQTSYSYEVAAVGANGESTRVSDSATTNPSLPDLVAVAGSSSATQQSGTYPNGCLNSGCHLGASNSEMAGRFATPCASDDLDMGDCTSSMSGVSINSAFRDLILFWIAAGEPD